MARENKAKREERRFGKAGRLADLINQNEMVAPFYLPSDREHGDAWAEGVSRISEMVSRSCVIDINNVAEYAQGVGFKAERSGKDFPCCAPAFPSMFFEFMSDVFLLGRRDKVGALVVSESVGAEDGWKVKATMCYASRDGGPVVIPFCAAILSLGRHGEIQGHLEFEYPLSCCSKYLDDMQNKYYEYFRDIAGTNFTPVLLAMCFMNCKNVQLRRDEVANVFNRERKKAGLKPFLRYHTINIEPMKQVLKIEGNVETEGLKRALHICRGHFSTYTEERPLFGRVAGTFWVPAHVRGSLKEGVVVSDYNVNAPTQGPNP